MALKGLDIFKLSPKKNCGGCGYATCMAFCMKVAQGSAQLSQCPWFSAQARQALEAKSAPLMQTVTVGGHKLGGETVLYRHERTLVNQNLFAVSVNTDMDADAVDAVLQQAAQVDYERIGQRMYVELVQAENRQADPEVYAALVRRCAALGRPVLLQCRDAACAAAALESCTAGVILAGATPDNYEAMNDLAQKHGAVLGVWAETIAALYDTVQALEALGNRNLMLDVTGSNPKKTLEQAVQVRRAAIRDGERSLGYPTIVDVTRLTDNPMLQTAYGAMFVQRYGSVIVLGGMDYARALPLYGLRQNIYTDPQRPMKVESRLYSINGADENAPVMLTVDFALTYFLVSGEAERSKVPVNLVIVDAGGMSVLTAWASGKLSATSVADTVKRLGLDEIIRSRTLIIPGKVGVLREEIMELLPGWTVAVGPEEAAQLPQYLQEKQYLQAPPPKKRRQMVAPAEMPQIQVVDMGVTYEPKSGGAAAFTVIGERIHCIAPAIREAMDKRDPMPILERAAQQIAAGASCLDVNIGPAEKDGPERMMWAVQLLQENFGGVPLALDTANRKAIEAGIRVYDRRYGKPIINSADAGARLELIDLAAANDAICIALCSADGIARDNEERIGHCETMLERGMRLGMPPEDLWFDPLFLVVKGMQDKQMEVLEAIRLISEKGLKTTGGVSNSSNGMPSYARPVMDATLLAMAMMQGLSSAIVNPNDRHLMETVRTCQIIRGNVLYSDSYLDR